jgi:hypothetical protein
VQPAPHQLSLSSSTVSSSLGLPHAGPSGVTGVAGWVDKGRHILCSIQQLSVRRAERVNASPCTLAESHCTVNTMSCCSGPVVYLAVGIALGALLTSAVVDLRYATARSTELRARAVDETPSVDAVSRTLTITPAPSRVETHEWRRSTRQDVMTTTALPFSSSVANHNASCKLLPRAPPGPRYVRLIARPHSSIPDTFRTCPTVAPARRPKAPHARLSWMIHRLHLSLVA